MPSGSANAAGAAGAADEALGAVLLVAAVAESVCCVEELSSAVGAADCGSDGGPGGEADVELSAEVAMAGGSARKSQR